MKPSLRAFALLLILAVSVPLATTRAEEAKGNISVSWTQVSTQISILKNMLLSYVNADGAVTFSINAYNAGMTALAGYALLEAGVPVGQPEVQRMLDYCYSNFDRQKSVYTASCIALFFSKANNRKYSVFIGRIAEFLTSAQLENGMWPYLVGGNDARRISEAGDNSNTQFAILGLKALSDFGIQIPSQVWGRALLHFENSQNGDGGWGYSSWTRHSSYPTMTAVALASLWIIREMTEGKKTHCTDRQSFGAFDKGLAYLDARFDPTSSITDSWFAYYLYAVERVGMLTSRRYIGQYNWYRAGAAEIVRRSSFSDKAETAFALLFLAKGREPLIVQKLELPGRDWDNDHYDLANLTRFYSEKTKTIVTWQVARVRGDAKDLLEAPVLLISGRKGLDLFLLERNAIIEYMYNGGTLLVIPASDSEAFDRSFRKIMEEMFPDSPLVPLSKDHEVYSYVFDIPEADRPTIYAQSQGCVFNLLYIPRGKYTCKWTTEDMSNSSFETGVNLLAFLSGDRPLKNRIDPVRFVPLADMTSKKTERTPRGAVVIGQIKHGGQWKPLRRDIVHLMEHLRDNAGVTVGVNPEPVDLDIDDPYSYPILYITGLHHFVLSEAAVKKLREFMQRGGFLFADPACGRREFDKAFREFADKLFPDKPLEQIPIANDIFSIGYNVRTVKFRPSVLRKFPDLTTPTLEGIEIDGRYAVVYSTFNFSCGLDGMPAPICWGYSPDDSVKIATNIVLYALNH